MIKTSDKEELRKKHAELVEFLRQNLPEGAKRLVVDSPALVTFKDESGRLPVHWAASGGCLAFIELILRDHPEFVQAVDDSGWSLLMIAVSAGHTEVVKFLLSSCDVDVNLK